MSLSHWGIFPGWFVDYGLKPYSCTGHWEPVDWARFCAATERIEDENKRPQHRL